jgi:hypothetical protein
MTTNREKLHTLGAALHGPRWMRATARDIGTDYRNVARWAAGEYDVPAGVMADLVAIVERRALTMLGAVKKARSE